MATAFSTIEFPTSEPFYRVSYRDVQALDECASLIGQAQGIIDLVLAYYSNSTFVSTGLCQCSEAALSAADTILSNVQRMVNTTHELVLNSKRID